MDVFVCLYQTQNVYFADLFYSVASDSLAARDVFLNFE